MLAGSQAVAGTDRLSRRQIYAVIVGTAVFVAAFDHLTKWLVASHLALGQQVWPGAIVSIDRVRTPALRSACSRNCTGSISRSRWS